MKIISSFHDYYDTALSYQSGDDSFLFIRKTEELDTKSLDLTGLDFPVKIYDKSVYHKEDKSYQHTLHEVEILYFCGKIYPLFCETIYSQKYGFPVYNITKEYFPNIEELEKRLPLNISYFSGHKRDSFYSRVDQKTMHHKLDTFANKSVNPDIFQRLEAIYFIVQGNGYTLSITRHPELKPFLKSIKIDPYTAFQEIEMYGSGVLGRKEKTVIEISDEHKRDSKGFDKYSFKHRK